MLASHYAPRAPLRLDADERRRRRSAARLRRRRCRSAGSARACSTCRARGDLIEAAANLFSHLRALDAAGASGIAVMPIPHDGLGEAINDRLRARRRAEGDKIRRYADNEPIETKPSPIAAAVARPARALRRHRRRAHTRVTDPRRHRALSDRGCASSITAARRWCCGRARSPKSPRSSSSPTRPRRRSCRRAAIPAWSAARSPHQRRDRALARRGSTRSARSTPPRTP